MSTNEFLPQTLILIPISLQPDILYLERKKISYICPHWYSAKSYCMRQEDWTLYKI